MLNRNRVDVVTVVEVLVTVATAGFAPMVPTEGVTALQRHSFVSKSPAIALLIAQIKCIHKIVILNENVQLC